MIRKYFAFSTNIFKVMCVATAIFMVGFWALKFYRNEDVSAIEYISYDSHRNIAQDIFSLHEGLNLFQGSWCLLIPECTES